MTSLKLPQVLSSLDSPLLDQELESLLTRVYVDGGFTTEGAAKSHLTAERVRARGELLFSRGEECGDLAGVVVYVSRHSAARRIASDAEAELHLLATHPAHRRSGIGRALVLAVLHRARAEGHSGVVLWTQPTMLAARRLYEAVGFQVRKEREFEDSGRTFHVFSVQF